MPKARKKLPAGRRRRDRSAARQRAIEIVLAELAHEIRTPLTGILALGDLLASSELGPRERGWARSVKSTAEHLAALTSLIVDAARADVKGLVLRRELFDPRVLAQALATALAGRAEAKGLAAETAIASAVPQSVIGDPLRLRTALESLIDNAIKFTERGTVRLELASAPAARRRARLVFTMSDSGIGLSAAEIRRLFRPFAQASAETARRYGGAGLGLVFVKRIAQAMGGDLTVTSRPGRGSRFRLSVTVDKVADREGPAAPRVPSAAAALSRVPLRILCAEDNPYSRVMLNTILTELGHAADFVGSGEAALEAVARGAYDVVLVDVRLPGLDGLEATRRIRALAPPAGALAIIGISGRASPAEEAAARAAGMDDYLAKPLSPAMLAKALASIPRNVETGPE